MFRIYSDVFRGELFFVRCLVKAMETFRESRKKSKRSEPKPRKKCATEGETLRYLQKKFQEEYGLRKAELQIKKKKK